MKVKEGILGEERGAESLREKRKAAESSESGEKEATYAMMTGKMKRYARQLKLRLFFLGMRNRPLAKRLHVLADLVFKSYEIFLDRERLEQAHGKGVEEDLLEFGIATKQSAAKIRELDSEILSRAKSASPEKRRLLNDIGDMILVRHIATVFRMFESNAPSTVQLIEKLEGMSPVFSQETSANPLSRKSRHNPLNPIYPF